MTSQDNMSRSSVITKPFVLAHTCSLLNNHAGKKRESGAKELYESHGLEHGWHVVGAAHGLEYGWHVVGAAPRPGIRMARGRGGPRPGIRMARGRGGPRPGIRPTSCFPTTSIITYMPRPGAKIRGFVKNHLKITSETKEWQKIILKS
jgi:hypothetical protein